MGDVIQLRPPPPRPQGLGGRDVGAIGSISLDRGRTDAFPIVVRVEGHLGNQTFVLTVSAAEVLHTTLGQLIEDVKRRGG